MSDNSSPRPGTGFATVAKATMAFVLGLTLATGTSAQTIRQDVGGSERINLAGQLGTLSQRIIASACNLDAGISVVESNAVLQISADQFGRIREALLYGNRGFGILGEEARPRTLQVIGDLNTSWTPLLDRAVDTQVAAADAAQIATLANQSDPLLGSANILVSEITGQYADPVALLHADALLIDLAARQRLLSAKMSKDVCLIASGINTTEAREELQSSIKLFDDTLSALRNGLDSVGVRPPPTDQIADGLQFVVEEWTAIQPYLDQSLAGETLDNDTRQKLFFAFLGMEARMNNVVVMYNKNSKL
ncbi:type IV pili methyl-accepting chemotaxis transducer N-terminal domain-containing protein [Yoonia sp. 2307UL14-13]|uniref:type IV pili methyl-accepting chemotaxis transducer N-terminal domain-containing protein n=1 Tax=Yoonia sp. 2307UL14-13 TaxID=3126506 RepID=UPI0030A09924